MAQTETSRSPQGGESTVKEEEGGVPREPKEKWRREEELETDVESQSSRSSKEVGVWNSTPFEVRDTPGLEWTRHLRRFYLGSKKSRTGFPFSYFNLLSRDQVTVMLLFRRSIHLEIERYNRLTIFFLNHPMCDYREKKEG